MAGFYAAANQKEKTLAMYAKALELEPENVNILHAAGRFQLSQGDLAEAEKKINQMLQKRPNYFPARMLKAEWLVAKRDFGAAVELLGQLVQDEPKSARVHYIKGVAHFGQGDPRMANAALVKSLELEPGNVRAHLLLAEIALNERDPAGPSGKRMPR